MGYLNFPPNLKDMFEDMYARIRKLETAQRFTSPVVTSDPANKRNGDIWLNSTSNALKYQDGSGNLQTLIGAPVTTFVPVVTAQTGTITTYTATSSYVQIGKFCSLNVSITITNAGTGAGFLNFTLPFTSNSNSTGAYRENAVVGTEGSIFTSASATLGTAISATNTTPIVTGYQIVGTLNYITA